MKKGFNNQKYLTLQTEKILQRVNQFHNKLYIEFGGKLFDDSHAARVLPGFDPNVKVQVMKKLKDRLEVLFVINAKDIEKNKIRSDLGIAYDMDILRQIDKINKMGIRSNKIVITQFEGELSALTFKNKVEMRNLKVYLHSYTKGYPNDIETIVSEEGYGANPYIETEMPIVLVTAPGPGSGKLATCLSQIYHEYKRGIKAGYAKYETFPIWNLALKHPVNIAYEAATADLNDVNMIDSFHLEKYGEKTVNYNRDLAVFPILSNILHKIYGTDIYFSPTDMGVNMAGFAIEDENIVIEAAKKEIIRRYYHHQLELKKGTGSMDSIKKIEMLMVELNINPNSRLVVSKALAKYLEKKKIVIALELPNGKIITGKNTSLMTASASVILNSLKHLAKINDSVRLLSPLVLDPILKFRNDLYHDNNSLLDLYDVLIALNISAATNPTVELALSKLDKLKYCEAHSSHVIPNNDSRLFKTLNINLTQEPRFFSEDLYEN